LDKANFSLEKKKQVQERKRNGRKTKPREERGGGKGKKT